MGKKLRIVFLSRYTNSVERGVEVHVKELSKRLSKYHGVDVFFGRNADSLDKVLRGKYNLVIPTNGRWQALKMGLGRLIGGYKLLIAGHAGIGRDDIWNLSFVCPNVFVALSKRQYGWAKKWAFFPEVVEIPNGIDLEKFKPEGKRINLGLKKPVVLSVGALEWYKYHDRTIKALTLVNEVSLLLVGSGSEENRLKDLGESLLGKDRFRIVKFPYEQMPQVYRSADLFVLPSWDREAFGIVYLEALASGLSAVAPDDLIRQEVVSEAGILTDTSDVNKYAAAVKKALGRDWKDMPRLQAKKFSWDKIAEQYNKLFVEMFKGQYYG